MSLEARVPYGRIIAGHNLTADIVNPCHILSCNGSEIMARAAS